MHNLSDYVGQTSVVQSLVYVTLQEPAKKNNAKNMANHFRSYMTMNSFGISKYMIN